MRPIPYLIVICSMLVSFALVSCSKPTPEDNAPVFPGPVLKPKPVIAFIRPLRGQPGTIDTIVGSGFSDTVLNNQVFFNGSPGEILTATANQLTVRVPALASTGTISVRVGNDTVTGPVFQVVGIPLITSIHPTHGPHGTMDTIRGSGFRGFNSSQDTVTVNGVKAEVINANDSILIVRVPLKAGTGKVSINLNGVSALGPEFIYELSPYLTTVAGAAYMGWKDGQGEAASFGTPVDLAFDNNGNLYVVDLGSYIIRKITPSYMVTTFAGIAGAQGNTDGIGSQAKFRFPYGVAVGPDNNIYVADADGGTIRRITPDGVVSTFVDSLRSPVGVACDRSGNLYITTSRSSAILKCTSAGVVTFFAGIEGANGSANGPANQATFDDPWGICTDGDDNVYITDRSNHNIRKISAAGIVSTIAGGNGGTSGGAIDGPGVSARFNTPRGIAVDKDGIIYVADAGNNAIRKITPSGIVSTMVKPVSTYNSSPDFFNGAFGIAVSNSGEVYIVNTGESKIQKISWQ